MTVLREGLTAKETFNVIISGWTTMMYASDARKYGCNVKLHEHITLLYNAIILQITNEVGK